MSQDPPITREVTIGSVTAGGSHRHLLIAGPCVIENEAMALETAARLKEIAQAVGFPFVFKSSYDKANRSSGNSFRGMGIREGLAILAKVKAQVGVPVLTDVHAVDEAREAGQVVDVLQIPAFLCRQTDLLVAAAETGKVVNVKKGQFLAPGDMGNVVKKLEEAGSKRILLTERGATFGYHNLVVDMRSLPIMRRFGYPVIFDATHSVQLPGGEGTKSGGQREFVPHLASAAAAAGCDGFFMEVHPNPAAALSDGPNQVPLHEVKRLLERLARICVAAGKGPEFSL